MIRPTAEQRERVKKMLQVRRPSWFSDNTGKSCSVKSCGGEPFYWTGGGLFCSKHREEAVIAHKESKRHWNRKAKAAYYAKQSKKLRIVYNLGADKT